jgi:hypothetical protein
MRQVKFEVVGRCPQCRSPIYVLRKRNTGKRTVVDLRMTCTCVEVNKIDIPWKPAKEGTLCL